MVREGIAWFSAKGVLTAADTATVVAPSYGATYDTTQSATTLPTRLATVWVRVRNNSNFPFNAANAVSLSYHWYDAAGRLIHWDGLRTAIDIAPNQIADVPVRVQPPTTPGTYRVAFDLVRDGVAWFSSKGVPAAMLTVSVTDPAYFAQYAPPQQHTAPRDQTATVPVTITNSGSLTWSETQFFLAYHLYRNGVLYVWDGLRTALPGPVAPGQSVTVNASVKLPLTPGTYSAQFDLVHEGVTWFSGRGVPTGAMQLISQ